MIQNWISGSNSSNLSSIDFGHAGSSIHSISPLSTDSAWIESFNGTLRDECLNVHWFDDLKDARWILQAWQQEYNETSHQRSIDELSPQEFEALWAQRKSEIH